MLRTLYDHNVYFHENIPSQPANIYIQVYFQSRYIENGKYPSDPDISFFHLFANFLIVVNFGFHLLLISILIFFS